MIETLRPVAMTATVFALLSGCQSQSAPQTPSADENSGGEKAEALPPPKTAPQSSGDAATAQQPSTPIDYESIVNDSSRSVADRALDPGRHPVELLEFYGIKPGMHVAELAAGGGYTAELLARAVGPNGKVIGQNSPFILKRFAETPWSERLKKPIMASVERVDSEMEAPLPGHQGDLDAVFMVLFYHDTVWFETPRAQMNQAVFSALKPGGFFAVVDHSAAPGSGVSHAKSLHRIEESTVIEEITEAGFVLKKSGDFLRNPDDQRDWNASPSQAGQQRGTSDRFVLLFEKPLGASTEQPPARNEEAPVSCEEPRRKMCTKDYRPVCAIMDTQVRCIKAPCPSSATRTVSNACMACAEPRVSGYVPGPCPPSP